MMLDNKLLVISDTDKEKLLFNHKGLHNYKFMSFNELIEGLFFTYAPKTTYYLSKKYNLPVSIVNEVKKYLFFVENKQYKSEKLNYLVSIKNDLISKNMIYQNKAKQALLKKYDVVLYNFINSKENNYLILKLNEITNAYYYNINLEEKEYVAYKLETKEEEMSFIFKEIDKLIKSGILENEISILNVNKSDYELLHKMSSLFNVSCNIPSTGNILNSNVVRMFINHLDEVNNFEEIFSLLVEYKNSYVYNKLIDIINNYDLSKVLPCDAKNFIYSVLSNTKYEAVLYDNAVNINKSSTYNFFVNANENLAPMTIKDEGYLQSVDLEELNLDNTDRLNEINEEKLLTNLKSLSNLVMSFHNQDDGICTKPADIISKLDTNIVVPKYEYGYSAKMDEIHLAIALENYTRYGILDTDLKTYKLDFTNKKYDNSYKFNNKVLFDSYLESLEEYTLSYSSMKTYSLCPFSYYLTKVLKIDSFEENMGQILGNYAHDMLQNSYEVEFDLDKYSDEYILKLPTNKQRFYANVMKKIVKDALEFNKVQEQNCLKTIKTEEAIQFKMEAPFIFSGKIDKLMYEETLDEVNVAIIDYKTSKYDVLELNNIEDGLNLQLPIYVYLLNKSELFKNKKINIIGIYLQSIINQKYNSENEAKAAFKLQGYSIDDRVLIEKLDPNFESSDYIKGMSITKEGKFGYYTKLITQDNLNYFVDLVDKHIENIVQSIKNNEFPIKPIKLGKDVDACRFCKFNDICYKKEENYNKLKKQDFKGGNK